MIGPASRRLAIDEIVGILAGMEGGKHRVTQDPYQWKGALGRILTEVCTESPRTIPKPYFWKAAPNLVACHYPNRLGIPRTFGADLRTLA